MADDVETQIGRTPDVQEPDVEPENEEWHTLVQACDRTWSFRDALARLRPAAVEARLERGSGDGGARERPGLDASTGGPLGATLGHVWALVVRRELGRRRLDLLLAGAATLVALIAVGAVGRYLSARPPESPPAHLLEPARSSASASPSPPSGAGDAPGAAVGAPTAPRAPRAPISGPGRARTSPRPAARQTTPPPSSPTPAPRTRDAGPPTIIVVPVPESPPPTERGPHPPPRPPSPTFAPF